MLKIMDANLKTLILLTFLPILHSRSISSDVHEEKKSPLKIKYVQNICHNRIQFCNSNSTNVCAVRVINGSMEYRDFENSCFLFLVNLCDMPGKEFYIVDGSTCEEYFHARMQRRSDDETTISDIVDETTDQTIEQDTSENVTMDGAIETTTHPALRAKVLRFDDAYDGHICPISCPETYSPVCLVANKGLGPKYFKFFTFANHCKGDMYYCKNNKEFLPPPDEEYENVNSSPLDMTFCGTNRYVSYARFSEVVSSMGHYGWLLGDDRFSKIVPEQARPWFKHNM